MPLPFFHLFAGASFGAMYPIGTFRSGTSNDRIDDVSSRSDPGVRCGVEWLPSRMNDGRELFELRELAIDVRDGDGFGMKDSMGFCTADDGRTGGCSPAVARLSESLSSDVSRSSMALGCDCILSKNAVGDAGAGAE